VAAERGLPISLLPLAVVDSDGNPLTGPAMLQSAQRYGGDEVLVGRGDGAAPDSELQWTLYTRSANESWNGSLAAGIDHTVDLLVPQQGGSLAQAEVETRVRIEGVRGWSTTPRSSACCRVFRACAAPTSRSPTPTASPSM